MLDDDEKPQSLIEGSGNHTKALGDVVPFTLGSRHMARYIATMTAERQEAFEVEMAQARARVRLQEARRAKEAEEREKDSRQISEVQRVETPSEYLRTSPRSKLLDQSTNKEPLNPIGSIQRDPGLEHASSGHDFVIYGGNFIQGGENTKVAIRVLRAPHDADMIGRIREHLNQETIVWQNLHHPNVLRFLGLSDDHGQFGCPALITPYCEQGSVNVYLKLHPESDKRLFVIKGVSEGLQYLHQRDVVHGDLRPSNILIHEDGRPLLCDFGHFGFLSQGRSAVKSPGACRYQAPELLRGIEPNKAADVYAFALSSHEIWTGVEPFHDIQGDLRVTFSVASGEAKLTYPDPTPPGTGPLWGILERCWKRIPEERLGIDTIVQDLKTVSIPPQ